MATKEQLLRAAKVLDRASRIIKGHFTKHALVDKAYGEEEASYCALGSIRQAHTEIEGVPLESYDIYTVRNNSAAIARQAVYKVVRQLSLGSSIPYFNDHRETTEDDVIRVMRKAARNLRKEAGVETKKKVKKRVLEHSKYFLKPGSKLASSLVSSPK